MWLLIKLDLTRNQSTYLDCTNILSFVAMENIYLPDNIIIMVNLYFNVKVTNSAYKQSKAVGGGMYR